MVTKILHFRTVQKFVSPTAYILYCSINKYRHRCQAK